MFRQLFKHPDVFLSMSHVDLSPYYVMLFFLCISYISTDVTDRSVFYSEYILMTVVDLKVTNDRVGTSQKVFARIVFSDWALLKYHNKVGFV